MQLAITLTIYRHYYPEFTVSHYIIHYVNCAVAIQNNRTPLHFASQEGHCSIVEYLITSGADINAVDIVSFILCFYPHNDIVYYLGTGNSFTSYCI